MENFDQKVYEKNMEYYKKIKLEDEYHDFLITNNFDTTKKMSVRIANLSKNNKSSGRHKQKNIIHLSTILIDGVELDIFTTLSDKTEKCRLSKINFTEDEVKLIHYHINTKNSDNKPPFSRYNIGKLNKSILQKLDETI